MPKRGELAALVEVEAALRAFISSSGAPLTRMSLAGVLP
jgi:hypothetical protein